MLNVPITMVVFYVVQ